MSEADPRALPALYLEHVRAGVSALEHEVLDESERQECVRLAWRLMTRARKHR